jgi:aspartyl-tRNA synthetase
MKRIYIEDLGKHIEEEVLISGWVAVRRDQGKMVFMDMRDMTGKVQCVVLPDSLAIETAKEMRTEWVVSVIGTVHKRPERNIKTDVKNGDIELEVREITVLNKAETLPFEISSDTKVVGEDIRLTYRYVDLRSERMQQNIRNRHKVIKFIRDFLDAEKFIEIETPMLTKSTPEGSRDYVVPARLYPGLFYALPQSPQQYKQLLMTAGMEKYFQIARCLRDEDSRGDRQPEFTQLDLEMSFVEREDVMEINERLLINLVTTLYPEKRIQQIPFPRMSYTEAMEKYNSDKPDIREDKNDPNLLAFCWVIDFPFFEKTDEGGWTFTHNPFSRPKAEHLPWLMNKENIGEILTSQYDIALNGYEIGGGSIRNHNPEALEKVFEIMGHKNEAIHQNFGHMMTAFSLGTPPHGGIAWGLDRFMMIMQNEPNIREVIPFAKTGEGKDLMMSSPAEISAEQLAELNISLIKRQK